VEGGCHAGANGRRIQNFHELEYTTLSLSHLENKLPGALLGEVPTCETTDMLELLFSQQGV
jgi:hypothetical protein